MRNPQANDGQRGRDWVLDKVEQTLAWAADQAQVPAFLDIRQDSEGVVFATGPDGITQWRLELVQIAGPEHGGD